MPRIPFDRRLLWLAPALAIVVVLGPFGVRSTADAATTPPDARPRLAGGADVRAALPSTAEVVTALGVVLAAGVAGIWLLARVRRTGGAQPQGPVRLRQSVRLSAKSSLHAVEFDGRVVLIGDGDHGPVLLLDGEPAETVAEDDGVELRDTLIPRPPAATRPPAAAHPTEDSVALDGFDELLRRTQRRAGAAR